MGAETTGPIGDGTGVQLATAGQYMLWHMVSKVSRMSPGAHVDSRIASYEKVHISPLREGIINLLKLVQE
jgi:hypothetical protein